MEIKTKKRNNKMKIENLRESVKLARIFILNVKIFERRLEKETAYKDVLLLTGCKESAAVRRSSMDLTRSLAKLRNE